MHEIIAQHSESVCLYMCICERVLLLVLLLLLESCGPYRAGHTMNLLLLTVS